MKKIKRGNGSKKKITAQADKLLMTLKEKGWTPVELAQETEYVKDLEPAPTRLDVLMSELETEINRAIAKMKAVF